MTISRGRDPLSVEVAASMVRAHGDAALVHASDRRLAAEAAGHIGRSDLYRSVCTILADRGGVYARAIGKPSSPRDADAAG